MTLTTDEALSAGQKYLGPEYREVGKPGSGVFHSADGTKGSVSTQDLYQEHTLREFRMYISELKTL